MLIYNYKKEFVGIDESDLKALGFSDLAELQSEVTDFADLFTKSVGYIHNFKHVHWIDYIACDDSGAKQKVIIRAKNKNYVASLDIQTIYLSDSPSQKAYIINLLNLKALLDSQNEQIKAEPLIKSIPKVEAHYSKTQATDNSDSKQTSHDLPVLDIDEDFKVDEKTSPPIDINMYELAQDDKKYMPQEELKFSKQQTTQTDGDHDEFADYKFSPKIASEALGLPVDLIEEFIQDFIAQANSFKTELYQAAQGKEIDKLKILSHKLKGVAANLRVDDALSILTSIGAVNENDDIETLLNKLFRALDRLSDKEVHSTTSAKSETEGKTSNKFGDDDFVLSLKDEDYFSANNTKAEEKVLEINDDQVPDTIEIAELADDDFYKQHKETTPSSISDEELLVLDAIPEEEEYDMEEEVLNIAISYDKELVANSIGLDKDSFNKLFEEYLQTSRQLCKNIVISMENSDFNSSREDAIELKGMSDNMRIHKFDNELNTIINSNNSEEIIENINTITIKLNQISNTEGK